MKMSEGIGALAASLAKAQGANDRHAEGVLAVKLSNLHNPLPVVVGRRSASESMAGRFFSHIVHGVSDCWYWRKVGPYGYGQCYMLGEQRAHRVAWRLFRGDIPDGMLVCHRCDVRNCVNPDHLFLGTYADNNRDRNSKGRNPRGYKKPNHGMRGELHPSAKLTAAHVEEIRIALGRGEKRTVVAERHGVCRGTIDHIAQGRNWRLS